MELYDITGVDYASQVLQKTMDSDCYIENLGTSFKDTLDYYGWNPDDVILQQDGDSKHTSKVTKKWLKANNIQYMNKWPPYSPDLNPIEHLWHHVKSKLGQYDTPPKTKQELFKRFETEWYSGGNNWCTKLYSGISSWKMTLTFSNNFITIHKIDYNIPISF
jgi:transposase